jgi:hypothetical protein
MKLCLALVTAAFLALAVDAGLRAGPSAELTSSPTVAATQQQPKVMDAESLAEFLKTIGYKDAKVVKPAQGASYCVFVHHMNDGSKVNMKGFGFNNEPLIELAVELKLPEKVTTQQLLAVLTLTNSKDYRTSYRTSDQKIVINSEVFGNEFDRFKSFADGTGTMAQKVWRALTEGPKEIGGN